MALALGLGSLFNHSESPNVSYHLSTETESIRYVTSRPIRQDEELYIFYGHKLWFHDADGGAAVNHVPDTDDGWGGLSGVGENEEHADDSTKEWSLLEGKTDDIIHIDDLPFTRIKLTPDDEEEDELEAIRTVDAWAVDITDSRQIASMLKWLRQAGLEDPSLSHLKRIRKNTESSSMLLAPVSLYPEAPPLPATTDLPAPYVVTVPKNAALTQTSLKLKTTMWPTVYAPRKKWEPEPWSKGKVRWAWEAMKTVVVEAKLAKQRGELPVVAYVPPAYDTGEKDLAQIHQPVIAHDTRQSKSHPLRHAAMNVVRAIADYRAASSAQDDPSPTEALDDSTPNSQVSGTSTTDSAATRNGSHYLLTSLTLFISHEPCIMCSMALLHSRVKEVFYLIPMDKTGGCGGVACVPRLEGVNHRYTIGRWIDGQGGISHDGIELDEAVDA
ncbi:hypothetical protein EIP91_002907 [Steccherinum ochraceum]|uniref:SET domain-containing protein n=1 Tax=Steccherinum ochraceum TaxID=92696 RepID=A0A4R0RPE6_9APHY|nr:hypothetical protein EIP91_002907 [Steccherinum ochraceum]